MVAYQHWPQYCSAATLAPSASAYAMQSAGVLYAPEPLP